MKLLALVMIVCIHIVHVLVYFMLPRFGFDEALMFAASLYN